MKLNKIRAVALVALSALTVCPLLAESPQIVKQNGRYALMVDGTPYLILGAQVNNSSAWPALLPDVWTSIDAIHANTVEIPVYWEQMEAVEGKFDFTLVDTLVQQAREHRFNLVLLWFGTWKNGKSHYVPEWIKTDTAKYPRMLDTYRQPMDVMSAFGKATLEADKTAFSALLRHLRETDKDQHTVLMVQVENEPGSLGTDRDYSAAAQMRFESDVPADLAARLHKQHGNWSQAFGADANEMFQAHFIARYIDQVVAAGKKEYPLPMYINVWLGGGEDTPGKSYPSGGAVARTLDVWKASASSIDVIAPDLYADDSEVFRKVLGTYRRDDNAAWIPETHASNACARYFFYALGDGVLGFSPFGVDRTGWILSPKETPGFLAEDYNLIRPMDREIARLSFEGKLRTAVEEPGHLNTTLDFGKWQADVYFGMAQRGEHPATQATSDLRGRLIVAQLGENEFLVAGFGARVKFRVAGAIQDRHMQYLRVENGRYGDGKWSVMNWWNGDQTDFGLNLVPTGNTLHVRVGTY